MNVSQHPNDDVLVDLAMQLGTAEDARTTMGHVRECPACEARFRELAAGWEGAAVRVADLMPARPSAAGGLWPRIRAMFSAPSLRWASAAAAAVILVIALFPRSTELPALSTLPPLTTDVVQRTTLSAPDQERMMSGIEAYQRGEYEVAITSLSTIETSGPVDGLRRVYLSSALAWVGRHREAITTLDGVPLDVMPNPWSAEARWTLYLSLVETGQLDRAQSTLDELAETPGEVGDRARALIDKQ